MSLSDVADAVLEVPVVTSFTRIGYESRKRLDNWVPLADYDLTGQVIVLTGATSGLGKAAATQLARCGAGLVLVGRNAQRNETVVAEMIEATGNGAITQVAADLGGGIKFLITRFIFFRLLPRRHFLLKHSGDCGFEIGPSGPVTNQVDGVLD